MVYKYYQLPDIRIFIAAILSLILLMSGESFGLGAKLPIWWITPIAHVALSAVFVAPAGWKIKKMRE